jgi:SAM-dependent methyltransferase
MKVALKPQNLFEYIGVKANLVPTPLVQTQIFPLLSRAVMAATKLNIFEVLKDSAQTFDGLQQQTALNGRALKSLVNVLTAFGYFKYSNENFSLTKMARKWCLKDSPVSVYNHLLFNYVCWDWTNHMEDFLKTGQGLQIHNTLNDEEWKLYQLSMEDITRDNSKAATKMMPMNANPTAMLDIGGSHGLYSVELCKKYPTLKSMILDLPPAVEKAKPILAKFNMGDKVQYWAGDALKEDLGENKFDLILVSRVIHHFTVEECQSLSSKVAKALKPGGYYVIQEFLRPETSNNMELLGIALDLVFNLSSTSGLWSLQEIKDFQTGAGLKFYKVNKFMVPPGFVQVCAKKI